MRVHDKTTHRRRIFATISETDLIGILQKKFGKEQRFNVDRNTKTEMRILTKDRAGTSGTEPYIEFTMTNDLKAADVE